MAVMDHVSEEGQRLQPSFMGRVSAFNGVAVGRRRQTSIFLGITHQTIPDKQRGFLQKGAAVQRHTVGSSVSSGRPTTVCPMAKFGGAEGEKSDDLCRSSRPLLVVITHTQMCLCLSPVW